MRAKTRAFIVMFTVQAITARGGAAEESNNRFDDRRVGDL